MRLRIAAAVLALMIACPVLADTVVGVGLNNLTSFEVPALTRGNPRFIEGLQNGETVYAGDFDPSDRSLWLLTTNEVVKVDLATLTLTRPGIDPFLGLPSSSASGFDFDPVNGALHVMSDNVLRTVDMRNRTLVIKGLLYREGDPAGSSLPKIAGLAFLNSTSGAKTTMEFGIDIQRGTLVLIAEPTPRGKDAAGAPGDLEVATIGSLGLGAPFSQGWVGFDITPDGKAYLTKVRSDNVTFDLYTVNLTTGAATLVGWMNQPGTLAGIAWPPDPVSAIPGVGRVAGLNDTLFRSDVRLLNPTGIDAFVRMDYYATGVGGHAAPTASVTHRVDAHSQRSFGDLLYSQFGVESGVGAIEISSPYFVSRSARVYNDQTSVGKGTFGQYTPAVITGLQDGVLPGLGHRPAASGTGSRVNVGWFNPNAFTVQVTFKRYRHDGVVSDVVERVLGPHEHVQMPITSLFPGTADQLDQYMQFSARSNIFVYASVIDNVSGDSVYVNAFPEQ